MGIFEKLFKQKGQRWIAKLIIRRWGASAALPRKSSTPLEGDQIWTAFSVAVKLEPSKTRNQSKNRPKNRSRGPRRKKLRKKKSKTVRLRPTPAKIAEMMLPSISNETRLPRSCGNEPFYSYCIHTALINCFPFENFC